MTEYRKVDVKQVGDELVMHVEKVFFNPKTATHKYPDFTFQGRNETGNVMLYMPENACRRQFGRKPISMEPEAAAGATFRFFRDTNPEDASKPYWSVQMLSPSEAQPASTKRLTEVPGEAPALVPDKPQAPAKAPSSPVEARTRRQVADAYAWCLKTAYVAQRDLVVQQGDASGLRVTMETVKEGAAYLGITLQNTGLLFAPPSLAEVAEALDLKPVNTSKRVPPPEDEDNQPW